jgi:cation diffusion facilitator family transporter
LISLLAALGLTAAKIVVGLATASLGILAEAVHSGLDAVAALLSLYAIGVAERPPDAQHQYGHGKAQHLAALSEAVFLALVACWIALVRVCPAGRRAGGRRRPCYRLAPAGTARA